MEYSDLQNLIRGFVQGGSSSLRNAASSPSLQSNVPELQDAVQKHANFKPPKPKSKEEILAEKMKQNKQEMDVQKIIGDLQLKAQDALADVDGMSELPGTMDTSSSAGTDFLAEKGTSFLGNQ